VVPTTAAFTVTARAPDVDALSDVSPEYDAVMLCVPVLNALVVKLPVPPERLTEPIKVPPSRSETLPLGTLPPLAGATAIVKVMLCPAVICSAEADSVVVVLAGAVDWIVIVPPEPTAGIGLPVASAATEPVNEIESLPAGAVAAI